MIKHTPAPWTIKRESMLDWHILCKSNVPGYPGTVARVGLKPNAQLIAYAPELLEICKALLIEVRKAGAISMFGASTELINKTKQVIKKIEGD